MPTCLLANTGSSADIVKKVIESFDARLAEIFADLCGRSIDFGGHLNPHGTFRRYIRGYQREEIILHLCQMTDLATI